MSTYDIRKQIQKENKYKLICDVGMVLFLLAIVFCLIFVGRLCNPFYVLDVQNGKDLIKEYEAGVDYVRVTNASLEFTGYYKEDKNGKNLYNCYATVIGEEKFFVFVPTSRSGENANQPDELLTNYSFIARMHTDPDLLSVVAQDYNMTTEEWINTGVISAIVLDEAGAEITRMYIIWGSLICVIILCLIYCITSYNNLKNIYKRKEVRSFAQAGEIDNLFDCINKEVANDLEYDSVTMKITKNYLIAFTNGRIYLGKRELISKVELILKVKKAYGFVKIGYKEFLQIYEGDKTVFEIPIHNEVEAAEVLTIMKFE